MKKATRVVRPAKRPLHPDALDRSAGLNGEVQMEHTANRARLAGVWQAIRSFARRMVLVYWAACGTILLIGLNQVYPIPGQRIIYALQDPAMDLEAPFEDCATANAAGYYAIPRGSKGYARSQDPEGDGKACEGDAAHRPSPMSSVQRIVDRLQGNY
jgi:hypothetical protein